MSLSFFKKSLFAVSIVSTSMSAMAAVNLTERWSDVTTYNDHYKSIFSDVAATPQGDIIVVGHTRPTSGSADFDQLIVKFHEDGTLDTSFGANGEVYLNEDMNSRTYAVTIQADGKIVLLGIMRSSDTAPWQLVVQRLNVDGTLDVSFADEGVFTKQLKSSSVVTNTYTKDIVINSRGEIIFSLIQQHATTYGQAQYFSKLIKLNSAGVEDTTFDVSVWAGTSGQSNSYSTELNRLILNDNDNLFAFGELGMIRPGQQPNSQLWVNFDDVAYGAANTNGGLDYIWRQNPNIFNTATNDSKVLKGAAFTPDGSLVSVGCDLDESYGVIQKQNAGNGQYITTFGNSGKISPTELEQTNCFNDVIYHPSFDALVSVGNSTNYGSILISNKDTGATLASALSSATVVLEASYNSIALLPNGNMAVVGWAGDGAIISVLQGQALTASSTVIDDVTFADQTDVQLGELLTSESQTLAITPATPVAATVYNGSFVINNAYQLGTSKNLYDADNLALRHTASSKSGGINTTSVVINTDVTNNASNKQWSVGDKVFTFTSKTATVVPDTTPDLFSFTMITNTDLNELIESETITITGINTDTDISVLSGEYSINGGAYQTATGTVSNGDTIKVRHTSSNEYYHYSNLTLRIGEVSTTFYSRTKADDVPDAFSFTSQFDVAQNSTIVSDEITIAGMSDGVSAEVTITNGEYSINGGEFTTGSTSGALVLAKSLELISEQPQPAATTAVSNGDTLVVRQTTGSAFDTQKITTVSINGVDGDFMTQTVSSDNTPDSFSFTSVTDATLSTEYTSNSITVSGINLSSVISIQGGTYSINGGVATNSGGYVSDGDSVQVFLTSSDTPSTETSAIVVIGGISQTYAVTTAADTSSGVTEPVVNEPGSEQGGSSGGGSIPLTTLLLSCFIVLFRRIKIK